MTTTKQQLFPVSAPLTALIQSVISKDSAAVPCCHPLDVRTSLMFLIEMLENSVLTKSGLSALRNVISLTCVQRHVCRFLSAAHHVCVHTASPVCVQWPFVLMICAASPGLSQLRRRGTTAVLDARLK
ncbi:hypothetical protein BaRGS_00009110 [Batillaria attramentaria]|uniref:Uncharacterized protein n=1 Tax=Batillaria attramentaria TaxID=370345 RepID=A0ABD0LJS9_9CAEN